MVEEYVGAFTIEIEVKQGTHCENREKQEEQIRLEIALEDAVGNHTVDELVVVSMIQQPHRKYRVLWDEYHLWDSKDSHNSLSYEESRENLFHKYIRVHRPHIAICRCTNV